MRERTGVTFLETQSHIPSLLHDWSTRLGAPGVHCIDSSFVDLGTKHFLGERKNDRFNSHGTETTTNSAGSITSPVLKTRANGNGGRGLCLAKNNYPPYRMGRLTGSTDLSTSTPWY